MPCKRSRVRSRFRGGEPPAIQSGPPGRPHPGQLANWRVVGVARHLLTGQPGIDLARGRPGMPRASRLQAPLPPHIRPCQTGNWRSGQAPRDAILAMSNRRLVGPEERPGLTPPWRTGNWAIRSDSQPARRRRHAGWANWPLDRAAPTAAAVAVWPTVWPSPCRMGQLACPVREGVGHHRDPAVPGGPPSKRPALPDPLVGGVVHKSSQGRADAQRLVATRLLDRLHDPLGHFSRMQRIHPRAR